MSDNRFSEVLSICLALGLVLMTAVSASADIPRKINYQGRVTDSSTGDALPGNHDITFRIHDSATEGILLWTEQQNATADSVGVFSTILGSITPIEVSFEGPLLARDRSRWRGSHAKA